MATPEWSKLEVRAVVRFLFSKGTKPSEIHKKIAETYGKGAMSRSRVYQWCTWFGEGRTSLSDEPKSGSPKTSTNEENKIRVDELVRCDRRMKIREIALKLKIPKCTVHEIVHDTLGYRKVSEEPRIKPENFEWGGGAAPRPSSGLRQPLDQADQ
ncbi:histone-lysine N-methyltransferase SETMAR [Plakobranchus ocellatus]|uniref:Histone-lysine N-methyltransferase SETMAR n=1 Tax=Plakobranchus ocellatus TaxID=259542 RepID=A0AAV4BIU1_9GAST|nr:histone-lysine N-methyltransferase SETMAR [Plakobranchus ocellatus]